MASFTNNTTQLQNLLAKVNELPEAGGSSGGDIETCTVTIEGCKNVYYTGIENGQIVSKISSGSSYGSTHTIIAVRNSTLIMADARGLSYPVNNANLLRSCRLGYADDQYLVFSVTGTTASILGTDGGGGND